MSDSDDADGPDVDASGPLDVATLGVLARRADAQPLVDEWSLEPDDLSPRYLELRLDAAQYPAWVRAARLDVRWFEGGDYAIHYVESRDSDRWQCRWDRHPKPGTPRSHYHPPPDATGDVEESDLDADHHLGVLFGVLDRVETPVGTLHGE